MLVMLNRFHNHVVEQLAEINENGRFNKPSPGLSEEEARKAWAKYDEDLFQTGRLYVATIYISTPSLKFRNADNLQYHLRSFHQHYPVRLPAHDRQLEPGQQHLVLGKSLNKRIRVEPNA